MLIFLNAKLAYNIFKTTLTQVSWHEITYHLTLERGPPSVFLLTVH